MENEIEKREIDSIEYEFCHYLAELANKGIPTSELVEDIRSACRIDVPKKIIYFYSTYHDMKYGKIG